ncbi:MAG: CPBP family intramembrane metalloprotease [Ruminococcaceae bacterium]|nr:CPBP family intramembrane metalloprotease [Oscillospiraceae bacterium]
MKERINVDRLLHTVVPFIVMVLLQRFLLIVAGRFIPDSTLGELFAFLPSAAVAVTCLKLIPLDNPEDDGDGIPPLVKVKKRYCFMSVSMSAAILIVLMGLLSTYVFGEEVHTPGKTVQAFLSLVIIHPIVEEYLFRNLFYGDLRLMNPIFAALVQAVMFAIVHDTVNGMIYALLAGIVLAVTVEQTGDWLCSLIVHVLINLRSYAYLTFFADKEDIRDGIDIALVFIGFAALIAAIIYMGRNVISARMPESSSSEKDGDSDE